MKLTLMMIFFSNHHSPDIIVGGYKKQLFRQKIMENTALKKIPVKSSGHVHPAKKVFQWIHTNNKMIYLIDFQQYEREREKDIFLRLMLGR